MAENGNNLQGLTAQGSGRLPFLLQKYSGFIPQAGLKQDGYDGTLESDPLFSDMNTLKQFALKNGKGV